MIGWLQGQIIDIHQPGKLVINVNGVGYDVETSLQTFFALEKIQGQISLYIHTVVREDALLLYGFMDKQERTLFRALIKVNGIGPKMAIAILSSISPNEFIAYINQQDAMALTKLPGIGKKTAQRLVVEMKDSLRQFTEIPTACSFGINAVDDAIAALEALGYKQHEAIKALKHINDGQKSSEELIRFALQRLASQV
ncbi:Holliday junction branch migration protein RuvA [Legionella londiniensis]|uniref:Holliday junction branch migration complex subunit RuvA n=1 Tax=Legionella londiniensis TaxID=45068 RepID=A0A0W0VN07_9GAMM|nr:Holliday junction branch migration protein RuvA [Legionella londiniensis]KTD21563.1 holliday junction DNA helicase [Legionella londiniensis]STX92760.1 holliday junction DNA helicase [Legionella londiniensis]